MGRRWCEFDPHTQINGKVLSFTGGGAVDPDANEVDGPIRWELHLRPDDDYQLLGTYDDFGHGEDVTVVRDVGPNHPRHVSVFIPVSSSARTVPFKIWVNERELKGEAYGDRWNHSLNFDPAVDGKDLAELEQPEGTIGVASIGWCRTCPNPWITK